MIAQNLSIAKDKIFIPTNSDTEAKMKAIWSYNSAVGKEKYKIESDSDITYIESSFKTIQASQSDVYLYYEYVQFKRAKFDCTGSVYDPQTGRIRSMEFTFTGKFE